MEPPSIAPILSYGVITIRYTSSGEPELLMAQKRYTMHYIAFLIGDYNMKDRGFVRGLFKMMTQPEKESILANSFEFLWFEINGTNRRRFTDAHRKFVRCGQIYDLAKLCAIPSTYTETEWEFPKGRPMRNEDPYRAAFREFSEETGIGEESLIKIADTSFTETLNGTDRKRYQYVYYLSIARDPDIDSHFNNNREVCQLRWVPVSQSAGMFREHYTERKKLIRKLARILRG